MINKINKLIRDKNRQIVSSLLEEEFRTVGQVARMAALSWAVTRGHLDALVQEDVAEKNLVASLAPEHFNRPFTTVYKKGPKHFDCEVSFVRPEKVKIKKRWGSSALKIETLTPGTRVVLFSESAPRPSPQDTFRHKPGAWHRPDGGSMT